MANFPTSDFKVSPLMTLMSSHGLPQTDARFVDARRQTPLTGLQQRMVDAGITDAQGRVGGFYGPRDLAADVASGPLPLGILGAAGRRLPFLGDLLRLVRKKKVVEGSDFTQRHVDAMVKKVMDSDVMGLGDRRQALEYLLAEERMIRGGGTGLLHELQQKGRLK